jgi:hypothetical protein
MSIEESRITVGTNWITVCNGLWHGVFLEDGSAIYPGPCRCEEEPSWHPAAVKEAEEVRVRKKSPPATNP